jgi:tetratricopeptide (TPR) repeat protein
MIRVRAILPMALVVAFSVPVDAQRQTIATRDAVYHWVEAVNAHVPGQPDAAVGTIVAMTYRARGELNTSFPLFMRVLRERSVVVTRSELERAVTRLARSVRTDPGPPAFLKRAAMLHADALMFANRFPRPPNDAPPIAPTTESIAGVKSAIKAEDLPPLLTNGRVILTRDGQLTGDVPLDWNPPFARSLLDELLTSNQRYTLPAGCPEEVLEGLQRSGRSTTDCTVVVVPAAPVTPEDREFASAWYHAVAAYLLATGRNGDATDHLHDAERVLPDDARLLFDRGTYAETFGLPIYQAVRTGTAPRANTFGASLPEEDKTNAAAERLYRRTLKVDPSFVEARVRLARLIEHRGQHEEASREIDKALEAQPAGVVGYYAEIVAGRVASARGHYEKALRYYRSAASRFRLAQSALLGASHAALMLADVPMTLAPLQQLRDRDSAHDADPWWDYQLGAGRDVNELLTALWARVTKR